MASVNRKVAHETHAGHRLGLWPTVAVATMLLLAVRITLAQQPPPAVGVREEVDALGVKYQVPIDKYRKSKTDEQKMRGQVRGVLNGTGSISDPAARLLFREFYLGYLYPMMTTEEGLRTIGKDRQDLLRDLALSK